VVFDPLYILMAAVSILVAFVVHEWAHGYTAYSLGDPTPKYEGRLTLNPLVHIDPIGAAVMLGSMVLSGGTLVVGWAKPVQFDSDNLKNPFFDGAVIAAAGPVSNFVLAFLFGLPLLAHLAPPAVAGFLIPFVAANLGLGLFNLIPCPPLDGWKVCQGFLPRGVAHEMKSAENRFGMVPLFVLLAVFWLFGDLFLGPIFQFLLRLFTGQ